VAGNRDLTLNDLVQGLRSQGTVESSGEFTLNAERAEEKLKAFQLQNPYFYVLKLIQAAVTSGADRIDVSYDPSKVRLKHNGVPPTRNQLDDLLTYLFLSKSDGEDPELRPLRHLAGGLNSAVACQARSLTIECVREGERYAKTWGAGEYRMERRGTAEGRSLQFTLHRESDGSGESQKHRLRVPIWELLRGSRVSLDKEAAAVWDRCLFCPVPILLNGKSMNRDRFGEPRYPGYNGEPKSTTTVPLIHRVMDSRSYETRYCHRRHLLSCRVYPSGPVGHLKAPLELHSMLMSNASPLRSDRYCSALVGIEAALGPPRLNYVEDGVLLAQRSPLKVPAGVVAVIATRPNLKSDLSGFQLIEDAAFEEQMEWLLVEAGQLHKGILESPLVPAQLKSKAQRGSARS
jgi:hypothetical protein